MNFARRRRVFKVSQYRKNTYMYKTNEKEAEATDPEVLCSAVCKDKPSLKCDWCNSNCWFEFPERTDLQKRFMAKLELKAYFIKMIKSVVLSAILSGRLA